MENKEITLERIQEVFKNLFYNKSPNTDGEIKLFTGGRGYDTYEEVLEDSVGLKRIYIGHKVPRIIKRLNFKIHKSITKGYYKHERK